MPDNKTLALSIALFFLSALLFILSIMYFDINSCDVEDRPQIRRADLEPMIRRSGVIDVAGCQ